MIDQLAAAVQATEEVDEDEEMTDMKSSKQKLAEQLKADNKLRFQLYLASELHMTLGDLRERITDEELVLWSAYYELLNKEREAAQRKAMSRRR